MSIKTGIALLAAAAIATAAGFTPALAGQTKSAFTVDFSADKDKKKANEQQKKPVQQHNQGNQGGGKKGGGQVQFEKKKGGQQGGGGKAEFEKKKGGQQIGGEKKKEGGQQFGGEHHKGQATAKRLHGLSQGHGQASIRGRNFSTWRGGGYRRQYHNRWVTFVPLTALAVIAIGGASFYPYAYIDAPQDYCGGFTEDDCELRWREVETIDGGVIGQCVAYCPWED